jgi:hypothetical protein
MNIARAHKVSVFGISLGLALCCGTEQARATTSGTSRVSERALSISGTGCALAAGSNDYRGTLSGSGTSCTITFTAGAYVNVPICVVSAQSTINGDFSVGVPTTTTLVVGWVTPAVRNFYYVCVTT